MLKKPLAAALIIYGVLVLLLTVFQERLLFFPDRKPMEECPQIWHDQGQLVRRGALRFYQVLAPHSQQGWLVYFHGNGGRSCDRYPFLRNFLNRGYNIVLPEYPGFSEAEGYPQAEEDLLEVATGTFEAVLERVQEGERIIIFGESLGTTVATYVAARGGEQISGLILQAPFPSVKKVGQSRYFLLPVQWMLNYTFPAESWAQQVKVPVYAYHGTKDFVVPLRFGRDQMMNFRAAPKELWEVQGAGHLDVTKKAGEELWQRLDTFAAALPPSKKKP